MTVLNLSVRAFCRFHAFGTIRLKRIRQNDRKKYLGVYWIV